MIILDTHVVIWLAFDQDQLSGKAKTEINDARKNATGLAISDITLLEIGGHIDKARDPAEHQHRVFPAGSRISVCCSTHERPGVCSCNSSFFPAIPKTPQIVSSAPQYKSRVCFANGRPSIRRSKAVRTILVKLC